MIYTTTTPMTVFEQLTYRSILYRLFDRHQTLYQTIDYNAIGYIGNTLTFTNRTTFLLALVETIEHDTRMKIILKVFLRFADHINFYHPSSDANALMALRRHLVGDKFPDVTSLLLQRQEIQEPSVLLYLASCITRSEHITIVLDMFDSLNISVMSNRDINELLFNTLIQGYVRHNRMFSNRVMRRLLSYATTVTFNDMVVLLLATSHDNVLQLVPLVKWSELPRYNVDVFRDYIVRLFRSEYLLYIHAHNLLAIYWAICRPYKFDVSIPDKIVKRIVSFNASPEQLILLECCNVLHKYMYLRPPSCPIGIYLQHRFRRRYFKFIEVWRHKTYRPDSKLFQAMCYKYSAIMRG